jgi:universal stress protein A
MKNILVPIDFSPVSRRVIRESEKLARLVKGRLILIHVVHSPTIMSDTSFSEVAEFMADAEAYGVRVLRRLQKALAVRGVAAEAVCTTGYPAWQILDVVKRRAIDYIVIGSHGHTAFHDLVVGSTTSAVLKRALCPVIVVPAPKKAKGRDSRPVLRRIRKR